MYSANKELQTNKLGYKENASGGGSWRFSDLVDVTRGVDSISVMRR